MLLRPMRLRRIRPPMPGYRHNGSIDECGIYVTFDVIGVRPAVWVLF